MSDAGINWEGIAFLSDNAGTLITNVSSIVTAVATLDTLIGESTDTDVDATLFGKLYVIDQAVASMSGTTDLDTIGTDIDTIITRLGTPTDTSAQSTVFGDLKETLDLIGTAADATTDTTMYGKLNDIQDNANTGKQSADAALGIVTSMRDDLGINGKAPMYDKVLELSSMVEDIRAATADLSSSTGDSEAYAVEMIDMLAGLVNQSADIYGLELEIKTLNETEITDLDTIKEKLNEMNAVLLAIKESVDADDIVVKTWFESD